MNPEKGVESLSLYQYGEVVGILNPEKGVESTPYSFSLTEREKNPEKGVESGWLARERPFDHPILGIPKRELKDANSMVIPCLRRRNPEKGVESVRRQASSQVSAGEESRKGS